MDPGDLATHDELGDEGKNDGQHESDGVVLRCHVSVEAEAVDNDLRHDESMEEFAEDESGEGAENGERCVLAENVGIGFVGIEAEDFERGDLANAFADVDVCEIVKHDEGERPGAEDDDDDDDVEAVKHIGEHALVVRGDGHVCDVVVGIHEGGCLLMHIFVALEIDEGAVDVGLAKSVFQRAAGNVGVVRNVVIVHATDLEGGLVHIAVAHGDLVAGLHTETIGEAAIEQKLTVFWQAVFCAVSMPAEEIAEIATRDRRVHGNAVGGAVGGNVHVAGVGE